MVFGKSGVADDCGAAGHIQSPAICTSCICRYITGIDVCVCHAVAGQQDAPAIAFCPITFISNQPAEIAAKQSSMLSLAAPEGQVRSGQVQAYA